ncbi:MAG TPA: UDP-N-acetylmuramoyl-L-alanine--D-glutamate ligase [Candidatus Saccharimonadales bacterium]|nr:UDP-N-acetylmuramoyl-L-alanine--D-glutamate ligase [Candidatus Saccharimonadales bacterium]
MKLSDLAGKKFAIWGVIREGTIMANVADKAGAIVSLVSDKRGDSTPDELTLESGKKLTVQKGSDALSALLDADIVCKSPGITMHHPFVDKIKAKNIPLTSATKLWLDEYTDKTIAVTGSKGKSTTASLLAHLMERLGFDVQLGGNIGVPLFALPKGHRWYIAELSSHQTYDIDRSPWGAVFTALFPENLDWYTSVEEYYSAKLNLAAHKPHFVVANGDNSELHRRLPAAITARVEWVPSNQLKVDENGAVVFKDAILIPSDKIPLLGRHNQINLCLCLRVLEMLDVDLRENRDRLAKAVAEFAPLAYRLHPISQKTGLRWVDDGLSTSPEATIAALETFPREEVTVLVGGHDRGLDYTSLKKYLSERNQPVTVLTIPDTGDAIAELLMDLPKHTITRCSSLEEAVKKAAEVTPKNGVVLLSPGAASFGRFKDYEARSAAFKKYIDEL